MTRRIALALAGAALVLGALVTPAAALPLPPITGPLGEVQIEGPLLQNITL
ncbi:hypothetical protein [Streptomyces sp. SP18CS02]|uniref:hypothetical protein n=1 Tax=Streptomyces sp. SP18CS02 TaxID=3002531 RepID=UPI002E7928DD|nr:hypothetical protein [Streptomyces sp. SP18CS02]MEE1755681.1 hypothetical protein [Streptomyces sp. SP18CS02]